jgi:hypothetical protein
MIVMNDLDIFINMENGKVRYKAAKPNNKRFIKDLLNQINKSKKKVKE